MSPPKGLPRKELERIKEYSKLHRMSLALVRTEVAPTELGPLLKSVAKACGLSVRRMISSPTSDFGIAELNSNERILVVLFFGGERTELLSMSETDDAVVRDLEDSIHSSNFLSEIIRMGL
jgi:methylglyoxal synthase